MKSIKIIAVFIILISICLIFTSCKPSQKDYCGTTDKRFKCTAYLGSDDNYIIFTQMPENYAFTMERPYLEKVETESVEQLTTFDCIVISNDGFSNQIKLSEKYIFDCRPPTAGRYSMTMKIKHSESKSYQPVRGETCLLIQQQSQSNWECTGSAYYVFTVK